MTEEEYLAWRDRLVVSDEQHDSVVELANGRVFRICHRPMPDRGWVATHEDITDLKRREASFRLLFEENPLPMWVADVNTLELLAVNAATCRHYGYTREQMLSMNVEDLRVPEEIRRGSRRIPPASGHADGARYPPSRHGRWQNHRGGDRGAAAAL